MFKLPPIIDYPDVLAKPTAVPRDPKQDKVAWLALKDLTDKFQFQILLPKAPMFPPLKAEPFSEGYIAEPYFKKSQTPLEVTPIVDDDAVMRKGRLASYRKLSIYDRVVKKLLEPYLAWDCTQGSFRTSGTSAFDGFHTLVVESVTHELGHLFHLENPPPMTSPTSLTEYLSSLPIERQQQSEIEARATNHLVAEKFIALDKHADTTRWVGPVTPQGDLKPNDAAILEQAMNPKTQAIAAQIFAMLVSIELPSVERAAHHLKLDF